LIDQARMRNGDAVGINVRHTAALALVGWYLMVPAAASKYGDANASPTPSIWDSYKTRDDCQKERESLLNDPVIGPRMKDAHCLPGTDDPRANSK
jgi:hypothetical protein